MVKRKKKYKQEKTQEGNLPVAYGNCNCRCHKEPGIEHITPCCYSGFYNRNESEEENLEHESTKKFLVE